LSRRLGGLILTIAVWPTVFLEVLRGWPLNRIESGVPRLLANNATVVAGGLLTSWALSASGLTAETINSVCGCVIAGGLLGGAHRRRDTELLGHLMLRMLAEEATISMTATNDTRRADASWEA
jgi:hypothetical protein